MSNPNPSPMPPSAEPGGDPVLPGDVEPGTETAINTEIPTPSTSGPHQNPQKIAPDTRTTGPHQGI